MTHLVPFLTEHALAPVVPIPSPDTAAAILSVAEALQPDLARGFQIDALRLRVGAERFQQFSTPFPMGLAGR